MSTWLEVLDKLLLMFARNLGTAPKSYHRRPSLRKAFRLTKPIGLRWYEYGRDFPGLGQALRTKAPAAMMRIETLYKHAGRSIPCPLHYRIEIQTHTMRSMLTARVQKMGYEPSSNYVLHMTSEKHPQTPGPLVSQRGSCRNDSNETENILRKKPSLPKH